MKLSAVSDFLLFKGDSRYTVFDHVPEQRERWLRVRTSYLDFTEIKLLN